MIRASDYVRAVVLWWVGRLLMLDTRIGNWQNRKLRRELTSKVGAKVVHLVRGGDA